MHSVRVFAPMIARAARPPTVSTSAGGEVAAPPHATSRRGGARRGWACDRRVRRECGPDSSASPRRSRTWRRTPPRRARASGGGCCPARPRQGRSSLSLDDARRLAVEIRASAGGAVDDREPTRSGSRRRGSDGIGQGRAGARRSSGSGSPVLTACYQIADAQGLGRGRSSLLRRVAVVLLESVPNVSEGRDPAVIEAIGARVRRARDGARHPLGRRAPPVGRDARRPTRASSPRRCSPGSRARSELIDLRSHDGIHPRVGAADVVPIVPLEPGQMARARGVALELGRAGRRRARAARVPLRRERGRRAAGVLPAWRRRRSCSAGSTPVSSRRRSGRHDSTREPVPC